MTGDMTRGVVQAFRILMALKLLVLTPTARRIVATEVLAPIESTVVNVMNVRNFKNLASMVS